MTEEILKAAIMQLRSKVTERFAIIKDLYHRPATTETVDHIVTHAVALAQLEGAMVTLQQYSSVLSKQTEDELESNKPVESEIEQEPETEPEELKGTELEKRSPKYRASKKSAKSVKHVKPKAKKNES
tara:strand:+ start:5547 stop:5930 length:384 start_codon:yes stop_codon:yes gene_type:complete